MSPEFAYYTITRYPVASPIATSTVVTFHRFTHPQHIK